MRVEPSTRSERRSHFGPYYSEGARLLRLALRRKKMSEVAAEGALGVSGGLVNRWLWGDRAPGLKSALRLKELLGVPASAWHVEPKLNPAKRTGTEG